MISTKRGRAVALAALLAAALLPACGACGEVTIDIDASIDAPPDPPDAPDAMPIDAPPPPTRSELTGGGRMTGGTLVMDVQLGHPVGQEPAAAGTTVLQPAAAIKP